MVCDVSRVTLGWVLMKNDKVITYATLELKVHPTHDLEFSTIVSAMKIWCHYLYELHVAVFTDHKCLNMCSLKERLISYKGGG